MHPQPRQHASRSKTRALWDSSRGGPDRRLAEPSGSCGTRLVRRCQDKMKSSSDVVSPPQANAMGKPQASYFPITAPHLMCTRLPPHTILTNCRLLSLECDIAVCARVDKMKQEQEVNYSRIRCSELLDDFGTLTTVWQHTCYRPVP